MPTLTVIAGPNGSGTFTLTQFFDFEGRDRLLDPDTIARDLNPLNPSAVALTAGREVLKRTADYFNRASSFAVETTLSSRGRLNLIHKFLSSLLLKWVSLRFCGIAIAVYKATRFER